MEESTSNRSALQRVNCKEQSGEGLTEFLFNDVREFIASKKQVSSYFNEASIEINIIGNDYYDLSFLQCNIPDLKKALLYLDSYERSCGWIHRLLHLSSFRNQATLHLSSGKNFSLSQKSNLRWLSVLYAACGLGLWTSGISSLELCHSIGAPVRKEDQQKLARVWLKCSRSALVLAEYDLDPCMDSLKAMALILHFPLYLSSEPNLEDIIAFSAKTIALAKKIKLDVDPDELPHCQSISEFTKDERRQLMIVILCQESKMREFSKLSQESPFSCNNKVSEDVWENFNHGFSKKAGVINTDLNKNYRQRLRVAITKFQAGQIWQSIGIKLSLIYLQIIDRSRDSKTIPSREQVLHIDNKLVNFEREFPSEFRTSLSTENCCLNPPTVGDPMIEIDRLSTYAALSSMDCLKPISNSIGLGYYITEVYFLRFKKSTKFITFSKIFILAGCISLAVLLMTEPKINPYYMNLKKQIQMVYQAYKPSQLRNTSFILTKSYETLGVLLEAFSIRVLRPECKANDNVLEMLFH
ncbi:hypothetical protein BY996DRAFT_6413844 [Phakopsora pachyrhizi]|nr:hypothetical protein BY996DRAFT_6413844 [Phakopsora pachyrhizi]